MSDASDRFTARITADGSSGWPVQPGRYRLVVSRACPWASRAVISRRLLGLEEAISMAVTDPIQDEQSWGFGLDPDGRDPVLGIRHLAEAYRAADPEYDGGVSVPAMVDIPTGKLVTNDHDSLTTDLATQWRAHHRPGAPDLYPEPLRAEIDEWNERLSRDVNYAVYECGFTTDQSAYDRAYQRLFDCLDALEERLTDRRYLVGETLTESDIRLFTSLVRFDSVYHGHFKCNRNTLTALPALWGYARDLFQTPGFGDTVDFDHIKRHYYLVHTDINPSGIVPGGPVLAHWAAPHDRHRLGGRPFGAGGPPGPPPTAETVPPLPTATVPAA